MATYSQQHFPQYCHCDVPDSVHHFMLPAPCIISVVHTFCLLAIEILLLYVHRCVMAVAVMVFIAGTALDYIYDGSPAGTSDLVVIKLNHHSGPYSSNIATRTSI